MKYTTEITIDLPRDRVVELFKDPNNLPHWQEGFQSIEPIIGEPGQTGASSKLTYQMGKREIEMIETIQETNLPQSFTVTYEAKGVFNIVRNQFVPISDTQSKWVGEHEFKFSGLMAFMSLFMKGAFKRQTMKYAEQFKAFAEGKVEV